MCSRLRLVYGKGDLYKTIHLFGFFMIIFISHQGRPEGGGAGGTNAPPEEILIIIIFII